MPQILLMLLHEWFIKTFATYSLDLLQQSDSVAVVWGVTAQLLLNTVPKRLVNNLCHSSLQTTEREREGKHLKQ